MIVREANKMKNDRELCVTLCYKNMSGFTLVTVLEVCNLGYAYAPITVC